MTEANDKDLSSLGEQTAETATPEAPKQEPWTAEKVGEWNAYYDLFVAALVLVLCFFVSANKLTHSSFWAHLSAGREVAANGAPVTTDRDSYTEDGHRWVNTTWLSDLAHYQVFKVIAGFAPVDPNSQSDAAAPEILQAKRDQVHKNELWGVTGLVALHALIRAFTAFLLMRIRHHGPGLWWSAICIAVMMGGYLTPDGPIFGGIALPAFVDASTWGQLFLALELLWLFRSYQKDQVWSMYALIPLFMIWANVHESFLFGLLILAGFVVGQRLTKPKTLLKGETPAKLTNKTSLIVLGASFGICLLNPSFHLIYVAAFSTLIPALGWVAGPPLTIDLSIFSKVNGLDRTSQLISYLIVVGIGLASFAINRNKFNLGRFLAYVIASLIWACALRHQTMFAIVLISVLGLNGQEWYHSVFGTEGKLGGSWPLFSTGGRAVTLLLFSALIFMKLVDYQVKDFEPQFGFGFDADDFRFEVAEALKDAPFAGNTLNTGLAEGDALLWRAAPKRKSFIDSRRHLFSSDTLKKLDEVQKALRDDATDVWKPLMKDLNISAVMIQIANSPRTYQALLANRQWTQFYDDGAVVLFGQPFAAEADLAYFKGNRLDADNLVYKQPKPTPSSDKLPRPTNDLDRIYSARSIQKSQSHTEAAGRWLRPIDIDRTTPYLPSPAQCYMAIRDLRLALSLKPDDHRAYRLLAEAYRNLLVQETGLVAGYPLTPDTLSTINSLPLQPNLMPNRIYQFLTALNYAILTTPPPKTPDEYLALADYNLQLGGLYMNLGYLDLARDRLDTTLKCYEQVPAVKPEQISSLTSQYTELNNQLNEIQLRLANMGVETQAGPMQKANAARSAGAVGLAIQYLEEAKDAGMNPLVVKPSLVDLYTSTGQPEKALELWVGGNSADPNLSDGPGTAAMRQGRVFLLLGNYSSVVQFMEREALPMLKFQRTLKAPQATRSFLAGDPMATTRTFLELPEEVTRQAVWEFETGMASLEAGQPVEATVGHLTKALTLQPDLAVRPIIAYYLEKLGKPVPVNPNAPKAAVTAPTDPSLLNVPAIGKPK